MIKPYKEVYNESLKTLKKYQDGNIQPIKTGRPFLDNVFGGILPGDAIVIAGGSSMGKTHESSRLINNIFTLNDSRNYVCLKNSLEMKNLSTLIRDFSSILQKSKKVVLTRPFEENDLGKLKDHRDLFTDGRFFINERTDTPENLKKMWVEFIESQPNDKTIFIEVDHMALVKTLGDKKLGVDALMEIINEIKHIYPNVIFILLTQLNRSIEGRSAEKSNLATPQRSDIFQSDTIFQLADFVYVSHNPHRLGINEYMKVNPDIYEDMSQHFSDMGKKVSFLTYGRMFFHVLKAREDSQSFRDVYIEDIDVPNKEKYKEEVTKPVFVMKAFENTSFEDEVEDSLSDAPF